MARITVEDCEKIVENKFDLVLLATQRTRQIVNGDNVTVETKDEKKPIIALREIAAGSVSIDSLKESVIKSFRTFIPDDDAEEDIENLSEDDTYNPCIGAAGISRDTSNVTLEDSSIDSSDDIDDSEEVDNVGIDVEIEEDLNE
ncbi:MAG: DNA-directed RNA polymerase subunit omega [Holosporaceae bacterium]|nr:DNA-directed RNA polymerase subunit omega [Holosporaceae bacterium]